MKGDLISRQAAIDSIEEHLRCGDELYLLTDTDKVLNHGFEIAASCVYNLPSAQPEIVRCKDCKHRPERPEGSIYYEDLNFPDGVCPCQCDDYFYSWMPDDDWFCKNGERKED